MTPFLFLFSPASWKLTDWSLFCLGCHLVVRRFRLHVSNACNMSRPATLHLYGHDDTLYKLHNPFKIRTAHFVFCSLFDRVDWTCMWFLMIIIDSSSFLPQLTFACIGVQLRSESQLVSICIRFWRINSYAHAACHHFYSSVTFFPPPISKIKKKHSPSNVIIVLLF